MMGPQTHIAKETKVQRIERLKREQNPWEGLGEIMRFAKEGYTSIPKEWLDVYFRWWGTYTQGDGQGVRGKAVPYFMSRVRIPNGQLSSQQLRVVAETAEKCGGFGDITVRQNIQLHWVRIEDMPDLLLNLFRTGLTTMGSCGDDTRNITGCPLAGLEGDEICDASPLAREATQRLVGHPAFYNLPRKFKISITGCRVWCTYPEINDVGLTAVERAGANGKDVGFSLRVGGGLSTHPHFAVRLNAFVHPHQVLSVVEGIAEIFRDSDALRKDRAKARLKFLFTEHGWTADSFQAELERRLGYALEPASPETPPDQKYRDHVGVHPQKQPGLYYVGFAILRGRITAEQMHRAADLADRYGNGQLRTTAMQNLIIPNVPEHHIEALTGALKGSGLQWQASPFQRGTIACTGTQFCKLALADTKDFARDLVSYLERHLSGFDRHLRINVNGCPNACGQHWTADIGLQGCKTRVNGEEVDAFDLLLGGNVGKGAAFTRRVGYKAPAGEVPAAIERLLRVYMRSRRKDESFHDFCRQHSEETLRGFLAGHPVEAALAPAAPGGPPHGVES